MKKEYEAPEFEIVTFLSTDPLMAELTTGSDLDPITSGLTEGTGSSTWYD